MRRGAVCWIDFEPASPPEIGKTRPAVVVSNTAQNERLESVVVVPLSTRRPEIWPLRVKLAAAGLDDSYAVVPGVRQVSKARVRDAAAYLSVEDIARLSAALSEYLGD